MGYTEYIDREKQIIERISRLRKTLIYIMNFCKCDKSDELCDCAERMAEAAARSLSSDQAFVDAARGSCQ